MYDFSILCRHCHTESKEALKCTVTGSVPEFAVGKLIFNGPGMQVVGSCSFKHAFDPSAVVQMFDIKQDGNIFYSNSYVQSESYKENDKAGAIVKGGFGTPPKTNKGMLARLASSLDMANMMSDNPVSAISAIDGQCHVISDTPFCFPVDHNSLETGQRVSLFDSLKLMTQSPHYVKLEDGRYLTVGTGVGMMGPNYSIVVFPKSGDLKQGKVVKTLSCRWRWSPSYMHTVAVTKNYLVVMEQPLAVSIFGTLADVAANRAFIESLKWHKEPVIIHLIDVNTWKTVKTKYVTDAFFYIHMANAYEEDNHVVLDVPVYKDSSALHNMFIDKLKAHSGDNLTPEFYEGFQTRLIRLVLPLNPASSSDSNLITLSGSKATAKKSGSQIVLEPEEICPIALEMPNIHPLKKGEKHRYIWGQAMSPDLNNGMTIAKVDIETKEFISFCEEDKYFAETVFIPDPDGKDEDDGVIATLTITPKDEHQVELFVLDSKNLNLLCRGTVTCKAPVPMPLHGVFLPGKS